MKMKIVYLIAVMLAFSACGTPAPVVRSEPFTIDLDRSGTELGQISAQFSSIYNLGALKREDVTVLYHPYDDAVCLQYRYELYTYKQFWNREGRNAFIEALERYNEEYAARDLGRTGDRARYGTVNGYLSWRMSSITFLLYGNMLMDLGYDFRDRAPYFIICQREAYYTHPTIQTNNNADDRDSPVITLYFTRAQAEELAALFDPEYLRSIAAPERRPAADAQIEPANAAQRDDY
ncbi:MAG: hypothetical protein FWB83_11500 [Treponema sp.]|nr:hypothetical protein [Treponema sp.]